jgi:uncharacterized membrane protein YkvA (DUF1232 family)
MARFEGFMLEKLKARAQGIRREIKVYQLLLKDRRTPFLAKAFLALAVGYLLMPFDIIPDFIPVVGLLDDVIIVPALIFIAVKLIPKDLVSEIRAQVISAKK